MKISADMAVDQAGSFERGPVSGVILNYYFEVSACHAKISLQERQHDRSPRPVLPNERPAELIRTGRGDEGEWGCVARENAQFPRNTRILGTPLPLHPLAPRTVDPSGWCIAPRGEGTYEAIFGCGRALRACAVLLRARVAPALRFAPARRN